MKRLSNAGIDYGLRCAMPYGDQALFLRAQTFIELGGFRNDHVMVEDYELMLRLRSKGKIALSHLEVQTSARRWQARGVWKTFWINRRCIAAYHCGMETDRIAGMYRGW
ncbi:MAG: hypothetical protein MUF23_06205 [Pirellula sp.]|nr:hypothetical protein [Pirellula sp.]